MRILKSVWISNHQSEGRKTLARGPGKQSVVWIILTPDKMAKHLVFSCYLNTLTCINSLDFASWSALPKIVTIWPLMWNTSCFSGCIGTNRAGRYRWHHQETIRRQYQRGFKFTNKRRWHNSWKIIGEFWKSNFDMPLLHDRSSDKVMTVPYISVSKNPHLG